MISPRVGDFSEITVWNQSNCKIIMDCGRYAAWRRQLFDGIDGVDKIDCVDGESRVVNTVNEVNTVQPPRVRRRRTLLILRLS